MNQDHKVTLWVVLGTLILVVGGLMMWSNPQQKPDVLVDPALLSNSASHGTSTTPAPKVTVVEFGDYQCPACGYAHPIVKEAVQKYKDNQNFTFIFRNFPLAQHGNALTSARAAEAAALQGKFWEMHGMIYEHQADWENVRDPYSIFEGYAKTLGLTLSKFKTDYESTAVGNTISADQKDGEKAGVTATPTFYVNGKKMEGVPTLADLTKAIDTALAQ